MHHNNNEQPNLSLKIMMMYLNKLMVLTGVFTLFIGSCVGQEPKNQKIKTAQNYIEQPPLAHHQVALEVLTASKKWIEEFNKGKGEKCGKSYAKNAYMRVIPVGGKNGNKNISQFWIDFIKSGASNLVYTDVNVAVIHEKQVLLSANWQMNVGRGVIYQEKWEKVNGTWVITYDDFEILEHFRAPKTIQTDPLASHKALEGVIKASMHWTTGFNTQNIQTCSDGYTKNATLNPSPFPEVIGKKGIQTFWTELIKGGAKNLIYHSPTFTSVAENRVVLSSNWSMNIGEGKIYQEKWILKDGKWLLDYDDFQVLKQY
ncbi:hypothetical protein ACFSTE_11350 [Aquimarina hainanensis]|uniref:SnoaL-like domain-containing protein n=1 Tax=Aquimarina hainanensis TaxID=1578017 RepID=A0ABW5N7B8_9FLAO